MIITIKEQFPNDFTTRSAGEKLRELILANDEPTVIDFKDIKIASASFFDEGLAKLAENNWTQLDVEEKIILKNIFIMDLKLLNNTCIVRGFNPTFKIEE